MSNYHVGYREKISKAHCISNKHQLSVYILHCQRLMTPHHGYNSYARINPH